MPIHHQIRTVATILATITIAALVLTGCNTAVRRNGEDEVSRKLITVWGAEPQNPLLPADTNETGGTKVITALFAGLVYYDADGKTHNDVAKSIDFDGDRTYTVTLRKTRFADGTEVKAHNFVKAWNYAVTHEQSLSNYFKPIKGYTADGSGSLTGVKIVDDTTFTIELAEPLADFPDRLGHVAFYPLPDVAFENMAAFGEHPIGNGPYTLADWTHDKEIRVLTNDHYDGPRKSRNDGLRFMIYPTAEQAYQDLLTNKLDVLETMPPNAFSTFEAVLGDRAINQPTAVNQFITIPQKLEYFSGEEGNLRRQAISMAINRKAITTTIYNNVYTPAVDFTAPIVKGYSASIPGHQVLRYNPTKAKELWDQANAISPYIGEFAIAYNADSGHRAWVDAVVEQLKDNLGIDAVGKPYPNYKALRNDITRHTIGCSFRAGWQADYPLISNFLVTSFATGGSANNGDYTSEEFDNLVAAGDKAKTSAAAISYYHQAEEVLFRDLPSIPLWNNNAVGGYSTQVSQVKFGWDSTPLYYRIIKN